MVRKSNIVSVGVKGGGRDGGGPPITTTPCPGPRLLKNQTWSFQMTSRPPPPPAPSKPPLLHISGCTLRRERQREKKAGQTGKGEN